MLKVDSSLNHIPAGRNHVIGLHESINQPLVNIPNYGTAPTGAFVLGTRNDQGAYTVFVYLHQVETQAVVVYVSDPRHMTHEQYRVEEVEALRFVESMGFMVDNLHFPTLAPPEQDAIMQRIPMFRPPQATLDLYDVQEEGAPGGPTPAPIFGGLSPADSALLRHANAGPSARTPAVAGTPVMGMPVAPGQMAASRPPVAESQPPAAASAPPSAVSRPAPDPLALKRIGRFLGTFALLLAVGGHLGCAGSSPKRPTRSLDAQNDLGNQQLGRGQWAEAIKAFQKALEIDDENSDALRGLGLAYLNLGKYEEAERFYKESLEANPKSSLSRNELAVVYMEQRRCQEAVPLFEKVLEDIFYATPEFAEHNLAQAYACLGRTDEALSRLDKLVTKRPYFCLGYLTLSRLASTSRRPEATIQACDDFVHYCEENDKIKDQVLPQQSAVCYLRKGLAFADLGDVESARASFERCEAIASAAAIGDVGRECQKSLDLLPR